MVVGFVNTPTGGTRSDTLPQEGIGFYGTALGVAQVDQLGYWISPSDSGGTGVTAVDHTIALYHYNGNGYTDVAQATLPAGSAPDANGYAWVSIPTYILSDTRQSADYYVLTASCGTDLWTNGGVTVSNVADGSLSSHGWFSEQAAFPGVGNSIASGQTAGPTVLNYSNTQFGGPNIGLAAAVPEPASLSIVGLAVAAMLGRNRRRA